MNKNNLIAKFKKLHPDAKLPEKFHPEDSGFDIWCVDTPKATDTYVEYRTGLSVEMPEGWYVQVLPRSSISKTNLLLCNSVAIIDNNYRRRNFIKI